MASLILLLSELIRPENNKDDYEDSFSKIQASFSFPTSAAAVTTRTCNGSAFARRTNGDFIVDEDPKETKVSVDLMIWT